MAIVERHTPGSFCWVELGTTDSTQAREFYTGLFGWEARDVPLGGNAFYTVLSLQGRPAAALYDLNTEMRARGIPAHWLLYISVTDADATAVQVSAFGGTVLGGPSDVMDAGRMVLIKDPQGAVVAAWQPRKHIGAGIIEEAGSLCWSELNTSDTLAAEDFYTGVFGWSVRTTPLGVASYTEWLMGDTSVGGMMQIQPDWGPVPPHWLAYLRVGDCDDAVSKALALGAKNPVPAMEIPKVGRFAVLQDPQGAVFAVIALNPA